MSSTRPICLPAALLALLAMLPAAQSVSAGAPRSSQLGRLPLLFEPNLGQAPAGVEYRARGLNYGFSLTRRGAILKLRGPEGPAEVRFWLRGGLSVAPRGERPSAARAHYLQGADPAGWLRDVPQYAQVRVPGAAKGVDLLYYGRDGEVEFDYELKAGVDPGALEICFAGGELKLDDEGALRIQLPSGELRIPPPVAYQRVRGEKIAVPCAYRLLVGNRAGFELDRFDRSLPLVIDPVLQFATYLGGRGIDQARAVAVDGIGNIYVAGYTESTDFPLSAPGQGFQAGSGDGFVSKLGPDGQTLLFSTYLGGSAQDGVNGLAVTPAGDAFVAGTTASPDFPVVGAVQPLPAARREAFAARLSPDGSSLTWSTFLGGDGDDTANDVAVDPAGAAYLCGVTSSANFPATPGAARQVFSGQTDGFITKIDAAGGAISYSSYIGGRNADEAAAVAVDDAGGALVAGRTDSAPGALMGDPLGFPVVEGSIQTQFQGGSAGDGFAVKLSPDGSRFDYATYIGGSGSDSCTAVILDHAGRAYIGGNTSSDDLLTGVETPITPVSGSFAGGDSDGFVVLLNATGTAATFVTYIGGSGRDTLEGIGLSRDDLPNIYLTGSTNSADFPLVQSIQPALSGESDVFVLKMHQQITGDSGQLLIDYSSLYGGEALDLPAGIAVDGSGNSVVAGVTFSRSLPLLRPLQGPHRKANIDAFIFKLLDGAPEPGGLLSIQRRINWGFTNVGKPKRRWLKLRNLSDTEFLHVELGTPSEPFSLPNGPRSFTLAPRQAMKIPVFFTPTATGPTEGVLPVTSSDPSLSLVNVRLFGRGRARAETTQ